MNPPEVVYPFVDIPGRPVGFTPIERTIFITSLVFSRFHYRRVTVLATQPWYDVIEKDPVLSRLVTNLALIGEKCVEGYPRAIFWSTIAKMVACQVHLDLSPDSPLLMLDSDVILFDPQEVIRWEDPQQVFAAGYREPCTWEAYLEGNARMRPCLAAAFASFSSSGPDFSDPTGIMPINAGCLYFNDSDLLGAYATGLGAFMKAFVDLKIPAKPYFIDPANPAAGVTYFSEVMVADQQFLAYLRDTKRPSTTKDGYFTKDRYFTKFEWLREYPATVESFVHFWKMKGWLNANPDEATLVEQHLLRRLYFLQKDNPHFVQQLVTIQEVTIPLIPGVFYKIV